MYRMEHIDISILSNWSVGFRQRCTYRYSPSYNFTALWSVPSKAKTKQKVFPGFKNFCVNFPKVYLFWNKFSYLKRFLIKLPNEINTYLQIANMTFFPFF